MRMFAYNLLLALTWLLLTGRFTPSNFLLGLAIAYVLLLLGRPVTGHSAYFGKVYRAIAFLLFMLWELIQSNLRVALEILTPGHRMRPGVVAIPLDAKTDWEITLLANLITLTPGSLTLDISADRTVLYVHTMYAGDVEQFRRSIKNGFERRVLELLR